MCYPSSPMKDCNISSGGKRPRSPTPGKFFYPVPIAPAYQLFVNPHLPPVVCWWPAWWGQCKRTDSRGMLGGDHLWDTLQSYSHDRSRQLEARACCGNSTWAAWQTWTSPSVMLRLRWDFLPPWYLLLVRAVAGTAGVLGKERSFLSGVLLHLTSSLAPWLGENEETLWTNPVQICKELKGEKKKSHSFHVFL